VICKHPVGPVETGVTAVEADVEDDGADSEGRAEAEAALDAAGAGVSDEAVVGGAVCVVEDVLALPPQAAKAKVDRPSATTAIFIFILFLHISANRLPF
jgi:hypothetical protein